ncbi:MULTISPECIES: N-formylglutamate amidohydrolase [unclassified Brevundimonas]|uniref:N-formylglutamate amidohydrolase n=1 Tax=unclassified Brevundimonas TaxID=2622653 RepID=UPI003F8EE62D
MDSRIATTDEQSAFLVEAPVGAPSPLVFASPHSGDVYPDDMGARPGLSTLSLRSAEDALVDRLVETGPTLGIALIRGRIGRAYVDLNRAEGELDPLLIEDLSAPVPSPKARAGYGVLARLTGDGAPLYDRRLSKAEAETRIANIHRPYHQALAALMQAAHARHGRAVLIDWHSMPARAAGGRNGPDVVLGDRYGASCTPELTRRLRRAFERLGWRVALNRPYAGGHATQIWGRPEDGFHAIQIELNRALYFDEAAHQRGPGWERTRKALAQVVADLLVGVGTLDQT